MRLLRPCLFIRDALRVAVGVLTIFLAGCGGGDKSPAAPTPVPPVVNPPAPTPPPTLTGFTIGDSDLSVNFGGQVTQGKVNLSSATVPAGGVSINLASSHPDAIPPSTITLLPGTNFLVPLHTRRVTSPTTVTVTASTGTESRSATVSLTPGTFLSFASSPNDPAALNRSRRYFPGNALFSGTIDATLNVLTVTVTPSASPGAWRLILEAPPGEELRRGSYNAASIEQNGTGAGMAFRGSIIGGPCTSLQGTFNILDVRYGEGDTQPPGPVIDRLHVEFTQTCSANSTPLQGELFIDGPP
jgi:hypothetical protein